MVPTQIFCVHVEILQDRAAQDFVNVMTAMGLSQIISGPTHQGSHTLVLVNLSFQCVPMAQAGYILPPPPHPNNPLENRVLFPGNLFGCGLAGGTSNSFVHFSLDTCQGFLWNGKAKLCGPKTGQTCLKTSNFFFSYFGSFQAI